MAYISLLSGWVSKRGRKFTVFRDAVADVMEIPCQLYCELKKLEYPNAEEQINKSQPDNISSPQHK